MILVAKILFGLFAAFVAFAFVGGATQEYKRLAFKGA